MNERPFIWRRFSQSCLILVWPQNSGLLNPLGCIVRRIRSLMNIYRYCLRWVIMLDELNMVR